MQTTYTNREIWHIAYPILISLLMEQLIGMTDTAFLGRVGEVGAERIAASLEEMDAEVLALPSPHNASVLLRDWDGTLIVPAIHMNAFENGQDVVAFGEDFKEMRRIMDDTDGGIHVTPYRMIE